MWFRRREGSPEKELMEKIGFLTRLLDEYKARISELEEKEKRLEQMLWEERSKLKEIQELSNKVLLDNPQIRRLILYFLNRLDEERKLYFRSIPGTEAEVIVFHHDDIDGLASGALIQRKLEEEGREFKIFHIPQHERNLIATVKPKKALICSDLALNSELARHLIQLSQEGIEIKFFDHHPYALEKSLLSTLNEKEILVCDATAPSTTTLVFEYFGFNDEKARRLKELAEICDSPRAKGYTKVMEEQMRNIGLLLSLGDDEISRTREELARCGELRSKELLEKAEVARLLTAFTMKELENNMVYDSKHFQVYYVDRDILPLRAIKRAASQLHQKVKKDVYINIKREGTFRFSGKSRSLRLAEVFDEILPEIGAIESYGRGNMGGIIFEADEQKFRKVIEHLEEAYRRAEIQEEVGKLLRAAGRIRLA